MASTASSKSIDSSTEDLRGTSIWTVRVRAAKRLLLWHGLSGTLPLYLITEFPKSGGTWFGQMLAACLDLPFPRNCNPAKFQSSILNGHHLYNSRFRNVTVVVRDGRDVMCSAYYHMLFANDRNMAFGVTRHRNRLQFDNYDDIRTNLPRFIDYMFQEHPRHGSHFSWTQFIDSWRGRNAQRVLYEDLLNNPHQTMKQAVQHLTGTSLSDDRIADVIDRYSFRNVTGRSPGEEMTASFARKGIAGDWKNQFSREACKRFGFHAGDHLIELGYESSHEWIDHHFADTE